MSDTALTAPPATAMSRIDDAVEKIIEAQLLNSQMQQAYKIGDSMWHRHETIDDKLHDALEVLGQ